MFEIRCGCLACVCRCATLLRLSMDAMRPFSSTWLLGSTSHAYLAPCASRAHPRRTHAHTRSQETLVAAGGVPQLVVLLQHPNPVVSGQGLQALARLADHALAQEAIRYGWS